MAFYHLHFPYHPVAVLVTLLVGIVTFCALGLAVTILVPNADAAPAVVNGIYFPVVFISGVFYPLAQGSVLARIADWFPIFHMIRALVAAFEGGPGSGLQVHDLVVMLVWAAAGAGRHGPPVPVGAAPPKADHRRDPAGVGTRSAVPDPRPAPGTLTG